MSAVYASAFVTDLLPQTAATSHDYFLVAGLFTTLAVTLWTTILIAYRFHSTSKYVLNGEKPRFYNILEMIIQSLFIYSLALVANAVILFVPMTQANIGIVSPANNYIGIIIHATTVRLTRYNMILAVSLNLCRVLYLPSW